MSVDPFGTGKATENALHVREQLTPASHGDAGRAQVRPDSHTSVLVVDDVCLFREGLAELLRQQDWTGDVRTASGAAAAVRAVGACPPDVVLMSMSSPRGLTALTALRATTAARRIVALAVAEYDDETVLACAEAGATGFLTRQSTLEELEQTVAGVARGETRCSPDLAGVLLRQVTRRAGDRPGPGDPSSLTPREQDVLWLIERGMTNKQIALRLGIEVHTVKNHVHNILEKLQVRSRGEAAARSRARRVPMSGPPTSASTARHHGGNGAGYRASDPPQDT